MTTRTGRGWASLVLPALLVGLGAWIGFALNSQRAASATVPDPQPGATPARDIDERAEQLLRAMGDALGAARNFRFRAVTTEDIIDETTGRTVHYVNVHAISVARPGRLRVDVGDSFSRHDTWFEDGTLTVYDSIRGHYTRITTPKTVDGMLDTLHEEHGLVVPLGDLVVTDPFEALIPRVTTGDYLGDAVIGGRTCHHLAMRQEDLDWQVWIADAEPPVPLKLVITYTDDDGHPQFSARFEDWDLAASFKPRYFTPSIPAGAVQVDIRTLRGEGDAP